MHDRPSHHHTRRRKQRSDAGLPQLTHRDLLTLPWIAHNYAARLDPLSFKDVHPKNEVSFSAYVAFSSGKICVKKEGTGHNFEPTVLLINETPLLVSANIE